MPEEESLFPDDLGDEEIEDDLLEDTEEEVIGYKISPYFDTKSGDFLLNGSGQIITADEITAYTNWCENVMASERYKHDGYSDDIGIDYDEIFSASSREEAELIIESEISEALAADPFGRTQYVQKVSCEWIGPDTVLVNVEVVALDNEIVTVNTEIAR